MAIQNGNTLSLLVGGTAVEDLTNISFSGSAGTINVTTNDSASDWAEYLASTKDATISATAYVDFSATHGFDELQAYLGTSVAWKIQTDQTSESISGTGILNGLNYGGGTEEAVAYDFTIQNTGAPTFGSGL